ncbi:MAG: transposase family protein, partial [Gammaproteobacteria bacterium]|nr:transposase family protein [Gammaproteobacteria bacterium]
MDLDKVYLNPDSSAYLAGINAVYYEAKKLYPEIKLKDVQDYLDKQNVYSIHKPVRKKFPRNRVVAAGLDTDWQVDLICLPTLRKYNKGHGFILACVDVLSKFGWAVPLKNKKPETVREAFKSILDSSGRKPWRLLSDKGTEFTGKPFKDFVKSRDIHFFTANSPDVKAPNVERYIRTL